MYTNIFEKKGKIYVREYREQFKIGFRPSLFVPTEAESDYKDMKGNPLREVRFESVSDMRSYKKNYSDVLDIHGNYNPVFQYICGKYPNSIEYDMARIRIMSVDIETTTNHGFPDPEDPREAITIITMADILRENTVSFTILPKINLNDIKEKYPLSRIVVCENEEDLLTRFILWFSKNYPNVLTSFNGDGFDVPYLTNRAVKLLSSAYYRKLSPWGMIKVSEVKDYDTGEENLFYEWMGISMIDYLPLYKKFSQARPENFKLDTIAEYELKDKKTENPYSTFREFYEKDPTLFVGYNIKDVLLINRLDKKRKLLSQLIDTAYYAKVNYIDVFKPMKVWDNLIYDYLVQEKTVVPNPPRRKLDKQIIGAAVKEPVPGMYEWTVSFDAKALYPSIARSLNMSPETVVNTVSIFDDAEDGIRKMMEGFECTEFLKEHDYSLSANGFYFTRDKMGLFPLMFERIGGRRDAAKKRRLEIDALIHSNPELGTPELIAEMEAMASKDGSSKILNNSGYGVMAAESFRFFDPRISEGITATGQFVIKTAEVFLNAGLNEFFKTQDVDYVLYSDTDSLFIKLGDRISNKTKQTKTLQEITDYLDHLSSTTFADILQKGMDSIGTRLNVYHNHLYFKREMISYRHLMYKKKKYAVACMDAEGVRSQEPEIKFKGLEIVRRSTPLVVREYLRTTVKKMLLEDSESFLDYYLQVKENWNKHTYDQLAIPTGVNGMDTYGDPNTIFRKDVTVPYHVKASLRYNAIITKEGLDKKYPLIVNKDKIKLICLKQPNKLMIPILAYLDRIPEEFDVITEVDYEMLFVKTYSNAIKRLADCVGWSLTKKYSLYD